MRNILLIFIKNPRRGYVKTRLARTAGADEALRIYRYLSDKTRATAGSVQAERLLFYSDFIDQNDEWPESEYLKNEQCNGDLGERMEQAFRIAFEAGATKAVIIGSDCPGLTGEILQRAFDELSKTDFVLGPTPDGGYYLLGMNVLDPCVFQDIEWSTATVRDRTLEKIRAAGKTCTLLPVLADIDTEEDWRKYESDQKIAEEN